MRIAVLDCFAGISGDMTLAALLDLGVPLSHIKEELSKMLLTDFDISMKRTKRHHISAVAIDVSFDEKKQPKRHYHTIIDLILGDLNHFLKGLWG